LANWFVLCAQRQDDINMTVLGRNKRKHRPHSQAPAAFQCLLSPRTNSVHGAGLLEVKQPYLIWPEGTHNANGGHGWLFHFLILILAL
jgi:hypothetical protein